MALCYNKVNKDLDSRVRLSPTSEKEEGDYDMNTYEIITLIIMSCMLLISLISLFISIVKAILGKK